MIKRGTTALHKHLLGKGNKISPADIQQEPVTKISPL